MDGNADNMQEVLETQTCTSSFKTELDHIDSDKLENRQSCLNTESKADTGEQQNAEEEEEEHSLPEFEDINDERMIESDEQSRSQSVNSGISDLNLQPATGNASLLSSEESGSKDIVRNTDETHTSNEEEHLSESPQDIVQSGFPENVSIQTITINEDEDLFDFENIKANTGNLDIKEIKQEFTEKNSDHNDFIYSDDKLMDGYGDDDSLEEGEIGRDLQKYELYKYLTSQNIQDVRSSEVTPHHSDHSDHDSDEESDSGSESEDTSVSGSYTSATSEEEENEDITENQSYYTENPEIEQSEFSETGKLETEQAEDQKPKATPVTKKSFRPRMTMKMKNLLAKTSERIKKSKEVTDKWLKELELPKNLDLSNPVKLNITELNQYLTCGLCSGYLYEASTVTECMHTFCKTCIVRHCMEVSLNCPVCNILIHPTDPFVNIRLDRMIQDIVYKLLPNVAEAEMKNISEFYAAHPEVEPREMTYYPIKPRISPGKTEEQKAAAPLVSLVLESESNSSSQKEVEKKFVRVKGSATIANLCHFLKKKLCLEDSKEIGIFCCGDIIEENTSTLQTIREKFYNNDEDCLMLLQFKISDS